VLLAAVCGRSKRYTATQRALKQVKLRKLYSAAHVQRCKLMQTNLKTKTKTEFANVRKALHAMQFENAGYYSTIDNKVVRVFTRGTETVNVETNKKDKRAKVN
jgi:hypothetical protein